MVPSATPAALATSLTRVAWKPFLAKTRTAASRMRSRLSPARTARAGRRRVRRALSEDSLIAWGANRRTERGQTPARSHALSAGGEHLLREGRHLVTHPGSQERDGGDHRQQPWQVRERRVLDL